jgi:hypothetical protein
MAIGEPVKVYDAWNSVQAYFLRNLLVDQGIEARVASDAIESLCGPTPFQEMTLPVWVPADDKERARAIVADYEARVRQPNRPHEAAEPFCYHCGQEVSAGQSPCPSCGLKLDWSE